MPTLLLPTSVERIQKLKQSLRLDMHACIPGGAGLTGALARGVVPGVAPLLAPACAHTASAGSCEHAVQIFDCLFGALPCTNPLPRPAVAAKAINLDQGSQDGLAKLVARRIAKALR